jgi:hypothetical protein
VAKAMVVNQSQCIGTKFLVPNGMNGVAGPDAKPDPANDGGEISASSQWPESTVLSTVISTRAEQFIAEAPGDWKLRCHMTHTT